MTRQKQTLAFIIILFGFLVAGPANVITGDEIMVKVDAVSSARTDGTSTATMTLADKSGKTEGRRLQSWTRCSYQFQLCHRVFAPYDVDGKGAGQWDVLKGVYSHIADDYALDKWWVQI